MASTRRARSMIPGTYRAGGWGAIAKTAAVLMLVHHLSQRTPIKPTDTAKNREYCRKYREAHREQYNARSRAYAAAHPEQRRAWNAANRKHRNAYKRAHPEHGLFYQARQRVNRYGVPCTLTLADVRELLAPMRCTATGLSLAHSKGQPSALSPSIDRIEPTRGYVPGNVRLVCQRFNVLRKDDPVSQGFRHTLRLLVETDHTSDGWGA